MIETQSAYISKIDDGSIKIIFKPGVKLSMDEYNSLYDKYIEVLNNGKNEEIKFLIIIQDNFKMENQYMQFFKKFYKTNFKKAEAYLIADPTARMFFKVGMKLVNQKYPIKLFEKEQEALSWLKSVK